MAIKNKRILITAGPTWVPIDSVRVISNIASGETGLLLAQSLVEKGARVTLLLGLVNACCVNKKIKLIHFKFFEELKARLIAELKNNKYDALIHSAAVSDFRPQAAFKGKLSSDKIHNLKLVPLPKIIQLIRLRAPQVKLMPFKLELTNSDSTLIKKAKIFLSEVKGDFVVANRMSPYRAFLIDKKGNTIFSAKSKTDLVKKLTKIISYEL